MVNLQTNKISSLNQLIQKYMIDEEIQQLNQSSQTKQFYQNSILRRIPALLPIKAIISLLICVISFTIIFTLILQRVKLKQIVLKQISELQQKQKMEQIKEKRQNQVFQITKKLWLFYPQKPKNLLQRLYVQNNKYFAKKSGFKIQLLNQTNLVEFITDDKVKMLNYLQNNLQERLKDQEPKLSRGLFNEKIYLRKNIKRIISKIALLYIILQHGGILMTDFYCLTQTFDWLKDLKNNIHAKRGTYNVPPKIFAFYNPEYSSPLQKQNIRVNYQVQKYIRIFPGIMPYFIAAKKQSQFIIDVIEQITFLLLNPKSLSKDQFVYYGVNKNDIYGSYFSLATHRILQKKQRELDLKAIGQYRYLAVDYYNLYYITEYAAANKFFVFFNDARSQVQFQSMTKQIAEDWIQLVGPFLQITRFTPHSIMNQFLQELIKGKKDPMIRGSFVQKLLYPQSNETFIIDNPQKAFINETNEPWNSLNRNIWVYWHNGIQNAPLDNQVCVCNMRIKAQQSGFKLNIVSQSNLHQYLNQSYIDKIRNSLSNSKVQVFPQSKSDLVRLALLIQHGGIYFDVSYVLLTNLDWIVNIGRFPSKYIFNRYDNLPKVFMHFHPQYGGVFDWKINAKLNTKVQWQLPYENNFIAAQKGSEFIQEWFELLLSFYLQPFQQVTKYMSQNGLVNMWDNQYLMPMDTLKCVIGRRQKQIRSNSSSGWADASDYYKIWGINGYMGIQKYRDRYGYESFRNSDNIFVYRYPQNYVEGFIGKNFNLVKFYSLQNKPMSKFIQNNKYNNFTSQAHPLSLFSQRLIHKDMEFYFEGKWKQN